MLYSSSPLTQSRTRSIRDLAAERVSQLVMVTGIVTASSKPRHKATSLTVQCKSCKGLLQIACKPGMGGAIIPRYCSLNTNPLPGTEKCEEEPYQVCKHAVPWPTIPLTLQEKPEDVPTGELPRTVTLVIDRHLVNTVTPGTRVNVVGIYSTFKGKAMEKAPAALQQPYLRVVSLQEEAGDSHSRFNFSQTEIAEFERFSKQDKVHDVIFSRMAPNIFGAEDIKKAVACLLMGGSRKSLPDGTQRRGDINVLLLGDPSTAKSQFLKFASKVAPISVYTSGKGSSAAGLTATVVLAFAACCIHPHGRLALPPARQPWHTQISWSKLACRFGVSFCVCRPWSSRPSPLPKQASPRCSRAGPACWLQPTHPLAGIITQRVCRYQC
ncbi:MCM2/3/5 family-domain-containing protein [Dunaliella salina]|uniref:DNA replication licensing factor MCM5 n=1 Tax=Dunaliella salina TaxID=3046 RepID=A0ABQ7H638_DUNSA|nr:MCM2/3/5 family-domain-containing protein [Dunaliella salina]|eukprot:KAF5842327.1 MCM2/3/5 family-domain-containing protein [Dunaliella salina]